jgi:hypothetical protein
LALYENDFITAEKKLNYALKACHKSAYDNKRRILVFLIPIKIFLGKFPSKDLLEKY